MSFAPASSAFSPSFPRGFVELDERAMGGAPGVVIACASAASAVLSHVVRRLRSAGLAAVHGRPRAGAPLWQEIASRLGIAEVASDGSRCAEQVLHAARARRAAIVAPLPFAGTWDRGVALEIARMVHSGAPALVIFVEDGADGAQELRADRYDVTATLDDEGRRRFWAAVAEEGNASASNLDIQELDAWWSSRRRAGFASSTADETANLPASGCALFVALALVGRAWSEAEIGHLGAGFGGAVRDLAASGAIAIDRGWVEIDPAWEDKALELVRDASRDERARVAEMLVARGNEPWALARAAELFAEAGRVDEADDAYARGVAKLDDGLARREVVSRWMDAVDKLPEHAQFELRRRGAERALMVGEADEAYRWAKSAAALAKDGTPESVGITLLVGRSAVALGDLVTARVALERGRGAADSEAAATITVELGEVHYLMGDLSAAEREAGAAMKASTDLSTTLRARNILGKLLLADAKWDGADRHFAEDAQTASLSGDRTAELRARLNRGIALLSKGLCDEAAAIFQAVLCDGERLGDARACAFALDNLAVMATWRHDYAGALEFSERTLKLRRRLGDRLSMARVLANLAELYFLLGLHEQAEHAVAFGRRSLGPAMRIKGNTLSVVAARIALERGNSVQARREIARALVDCEAMGDKLVLGIAYRVAARVALDDGDVARARESIQKASELSTTDEARAEVALLEALHARAAGETHERMVALAGKALGVARTGNQEEREREAHVLLCEIHLAARAYVAARAHLDHAMVLRDRTAETLRADMRAAFLAQPSVAALERLNAALPSTTASSEQDGDGEEEAPRTQRTSFHPAPASGDPVSVRPGPSAPREMVGEDPAIRGLLAAIKKVARSNATVLVRGESGTGKELVAEALHRASDRSGGPLVTVNCAALVETLLLSELFGHEKGAFTGAFARRRGRFELAEGGTLFLDEIGDISQRTQVALLRVLQERTFERVGGTTAIRANVRIICATHRDLKSMVERGEFREDLYYRLRGITLEVPALRQRMCDLPRISESLLQRIAVERGETQKTVAPEALELLSRHKWPGNVRELENALRAASLFAEGAVIVAADLTDNVDDLRALGGPPSMRASLLPAPPSANDAEGTFAGDEDCDGALLPPSEANATSVAYAQVRQGTVSLSDMKRQIERDCIARALAETKGNITRAAALLGMKRPRLSQLVKQYGLMAVSSEGL